MTEPLQVGQFAIVDHEPVDQGPNAGIFEGKGPIDERAELFVLAEGTTPASEAFAGHVVTAIGSAWGGFDMSLSGCLTSAFREAERNIWDWNSKSIAQHQVSIGLTCFAHRGDHAIVAQAGPSVAFHLHAGELHVYFPRGDKARAIGSGAPPEPHLTRVDMQPGDRILLLSTAGVDELDKDVIAGVLALPGQQALQDLYQRLRGQRHITALLVAAPDFPEEKAQALESVEMAPEIGEDTVIDATHEPRSGFQPSLFIDDEHEADVEAARNALISISTKASARSAPHAPLAEHFSIQPLRRAVGESDGNIRDLAERIRSRSDAVIGAQAQVPHATASMTAAPSAPRPIWNNGGGSPSREDSSPPSVERQGPRNPAPPPNRTRSFQRGLLTDGPPSRPATASTAAAPPVGELAAERTRRLQAGTSSMSHVSSSVAVTGGAPLVRTRANMGGRWKGNGSLSGRRTATGGGGSNDRLLILGAVAVLIIVMVFVVGPRLFGSDGSSPEELYAQAQQQFEASRLTADPSEQRAALTQAEAFLLEAREVGGETIESEQLFNQVAGAIRALDNVVAPTAVETVRDLSQFGEQPVTPSDMEVGAGYVFLLDTASSQVIAQPTGGTEPEVVYTINPELGLERPVAMSMLADGLLVLDSAGQFWLAFPGFDPSPVVFSAPQGLTITDIAVNNENLYILDAPATVVYRFSRTTNGFEQAPEVYFAAPGLKDAQRLHIDQDVVTMGAEGSVTRYSNGATLTLGQSGIDQRIPSAQQIRTFDGGNSFAIPDPTNDRIVILRRDGTFDRQYQHEGLTALHAFTLDSSVGYVFSNGIVRRLVW